MHWRTKAVVQTVFSHLPRGEVCNYACQRYVFKHLPTDDASFSGLVGTARRHVANLERHATSPLADGCFYEFGAGRDLIVPLALWCQGVKRQVLVDIRRLARRELVVDTLSRLAAGGEGLPRTPPSGGEPASGLDELLAPFGIEYRAPCDARDTGLPDATIDYVTSTSTLEHIPPSDIRLILREIRRIMRPGGIASFWIDYQDHYSYSDPSISVYNFLRFEDRQWRLWSPSLQFQNRLRHSDHVRLLTEEGFEILDDDPVEGSPEDLEVISHLPLASPFRGRPVEELAVRGSFLTVKPRT